MTRISYLPQCFFIFWFGLISSAAVADLVKKSNSGLCHPPESEWYERTKTYQAFSTIEECLSSGGELPDGISLSSLNSPQKSSSEQSGYDRSAFGHGWDDADGDCQDSRAEALIAQSTTKVRFADESRCRVISGRWISPFTGKVIQNSSEIDIDHVVPLNWALTHGASSWSDEKREQFANDPMNLWPVELSLNRQKGAKAPWAWLPPSGQCGYVARFLRVVKTYRLELDQSRQVWIRSFLNDCRKSDA